MSNTNSIFNVMPVRVPNKSGFNCSHETLTTLPVGTLVPVLSDEICPNTTIDLGCLANVSLPPFGTNYHGKIDLKLECFFVPYRLLWGGWKSFISRQHQYDPSATPPANVPKFSLPFVNSYTGAKLSTSFGDAANATTGTKYVNGLSYMAYHKIYEDWYRDARIQKASYSPTGTSAFSKAPFGVATFNIVGTDTCADGVTINTLRQRNWSKDYFTTAMLKQSLGDNLRVNVVTKLANSSSSAVAVNNGAQSTSVYAGTNTSNLVGFTIAQLREINTLQNYMDTLGACGNKYNDVVKAIWGCAPADEIMDKAIYLGGMTNGVYNKGVQPGYAYDVDSSGADRVDPRWIDGVLGAEGSVAGATGSANLAKFTAREFGQLMVIASIVPHAYYSDVTDRKSSHFLPSDFATGILAGAGNQPIYQWELIGSKNTTDTGVFGWTDRYAEYKFKHDRTLNGFSEINGAYYRDFCLKRTFTGSPTINSAFLTIPTTALDDVLAVKSTTSETGAESRLDIYFKYNIVCPLPSYSIPTLGMPNDTHTEFVPRAGKRL